jgi:hypothetical protein
MNTHNHAHTLLAHTCTTHALSRTPTHVHTHTLIHAHTHSYTHRLTLTRITPTLSPTPILQALDRLRRDMQSLAAGSALGPDASARDRALHALELLDPTATPLAPSSALSDADAGDIIGNAVIVLLQYVATAQAKDAVTEESDEVTTCDTAHHALLQCRGALRGVLFGCLARPAAAECIPSGRAGLALLGADSAETSITMLQCANSGMLCAVLLVQLCSGDLFAVEEQDMLVAVRQAVPARAVQWLLEVGAELLWGESDAVSGCTGAADR